MEPVAIVGICAVVLIVGYLLGLMVGKSAGSKQSGEAQEARAQLKQYREEVSAHFAKSAMHFQTLGQNYRELYEHMAAGADTLFEQDDAGEAVAFAPMEQLLAAEQPSTEKSAEADDTDKSDEGDKAGDEATAAEQAVDSAEESQIRADSDDDVSPAADDVPRAADARSEESVDESLASGESTQDKDEASEDERRKTSA